MAEIISEYDRNFVPKLHDQLKVRKWYKLDNAATVYSLLSSNKSPSMFRLSCNLKHRINVKNLQTALNRIIVRFPYFDVNLKKGFFWAYWEKNQNDPKIVAETKYPCQRLPVYSRGVFPFRVKAYFNRIAVEFHHNLTDGSGGLIFLKALVAEYLHLRGINPEDWGDIFRPNQVPDSEEFECAYKRNYREKLPFPKSYGVAFKPPLTSEKKKKYHVTTGAVSVKEILKISREKKVTITELLTSAYMDALQSVLYNLPAHQRKRNMKPIRVAVPVNLRNLYPSKTMRNFSFMVSSELNPKLGRYSFNEILHLVHHSIRKEVATKTITQSISRNVKGQLFPLMRIIPLFLKRLLGGLLYQKMGEQLYSGKLSNIGKVTMPEAFANEIESFDLLLAPSSTINTGCSITSFGDNLNITFGRTVKEAEVEKYFFRKLVELGIQVKIETN
ncbi:MAG: hypothetical protein KAR08_02305 [Candidatus Heimdallarchaeota archaeon]|nr:hypothetical protein [Candidatus Heimdallarchaeota archaeon]